MGILAASAVSSGQQALSVVEVRQSERSEIEILSAQEMALVIRQARHKLLGSTKNLLNRRPFVVGIKSRYLKGNIQTLFT